MHNLTIILIAIYDPQCTCRQISTHPFQTHLQTDIFIPAFGASNISGTIRVMDKQDDVRHDEVINAKNIWKTHQFSIDLHKCIGFNNQCGSKLCDVKV